MVATAAQYIEVNNCEVHILPLDRYAVLAIDGALHPRGRHRPGLTPYTMEYIDVGIPALGRGIPITDCGITIWRAG